MAVGGLPMGPKTFECGGSLADSRRRWGAAGVVRPDKYRAGRSKAGRERDGSIKLVALLLFALGLVK